MATDHRLALLRAWIDDNDELSGASLSPASGDASFRRYFRVEKDGNSFIAMDAPPEQEDCKPFVTIAGYLQSMGLSAPRVLDANVDDGFLLLTDLGQVSYLDALTAEPDSSAALYNDALAALATMQARGIECQSKLPPYDEALLRFEMSLFRDWLCGTHLDIVFTSAEELSWQEFCDVLVANALQQPRVFVHRDYHSRNLMVVENGNPGILDFQDAVEGPLTYDLASLTKDCYVRWPRDRILGWADDFLHTLGEPLRSSIGEEQFIRFYELMGVQRHIKAAGIFARLNHRDGKPQYLQDIPRTLRYITDLSGRNAELGFVIDLINDRILPELEFEE